MQINFLNTVFIALGFLTLMSCRKDTNEYVAEYDNTPYILEYNELLPVPDFPADNPLTVEKVKLGRMLFYDNKLSKDGSMNCATCHVQEFGFSDQNQFSIGVEGVPGERQSMVIFNMAWNNNGFFWDGRAELLRHQSLLPIENPVELNESIERVLYKLLTDTIYVNQFQRAFESGTISALNISLALEAFMLTIISDDSRFDRYLAGTETFTESEVAGMSLFFTGYNASLPNVSGANCVHCHAGNNFENDDYMNIGLDEDVDITDIGRENVTGDPNDKGKFKVPSLRNIEVTGPYMHDGRFTTLEEVVEHYNNGIHQSSTLDSALAATTGTGLMLDAQEKADLVAFLKTLTDYTFLNNPDYKSPF